MWLFAATDNLSEVTGDERQADLWTAVGEFISSSSHYVDTMALLHPSHQRVCLGRSGIEAILIPAHFCVPKLFNPLFDTFIRLAIVRAFKQADRSRR